MTRTEIDALTVRLRNSRQICFYIIQCKAVPCKKNLTMRHRIHTIGRDKTNLDIPDHNTVSHDLDWSAERNTSCIISSNHCPVRYLNRHHLSARFCLTSDGKASSYNNILLLLCKCRQKLILIRHCNCCLSRRSHIPQQMILGYSLCPNSSRQSSFPRASIACLSKPPSPHRDIPDRTCDLKY